MQCEKTNQLQWSVRSTNEPEDTTMHACNDPVRQTTGCCPVSHLIQEWRLRFSGHVASADFEQDHHRVIEASFRPPSHWRRPCGCPHSTWLRGINSDVQSVNIGIHSAWSKASDRTLWRRIVDTATLHQGARHWRQIVLLLLLLLLLLPLLVLLRPLLRKTKLYCRSWRVRITKKTLQFSSPSLYLQVR